MLGQKNRGKIIFMAHKHMLSLVKAMYMSARKRENFKIVRKMKFEVQIDHMNWLPSSLLQFQEPDPFMLLRAIHRFICTHAHTLTLMLQSKPHVCTPAAIGTTVEVQIRINCICNVGVQKAKYQGTKNSPQSIEPPKKADDNARILPAKSNTWGGGRRRAGGNKRVRTRVCARWCGACNECRRNAKTPILASFSQLWTGHTPHARTHALIFYSLRVKALTATSLSLAS